MAILYYVTPNVEQPSFRWISVGAGVAILVWLVASVLFGFYVANFGSYNKTYGALAGVIVFLLWLWITNLALLFGAEVDAEIERGRQLQAGLPAERELQLPPKDTRNIRKEEPPRKETWSGRSDASRAAESTKRILAGVTRRIHVIGIGAGDPDYVTAQAVAALNDTQVFFAMDKGDAKDDLVALRRLICERFIREPGYRFVELPDPPRARTAGQSGLPAGRRRLARRAGRRCGPMRSRPNSGPAASARFWRGATRRSTTARCGSWTASPSTSTSTTTSSPASPRSRR